MIKAALVSLSVLFAGTFAFAATENDPSQRLQQAEAQRKAVYAQLESKLNADQKTKLVAAEKAWSKFVAVEMERAGQEWGRLDSRGQEALQELSATLTWSRVSHLRRMLAPLALNGSESEFRDADDMLNKAYKSKRILIERREPLDALKQAQLAWIRYRDAAAESESSVCPDPTSSVRVKTELTYDRGLFLRWNALGLVRRLSTAPPDLERELYLAQLLSDNTELQQRATDHFVGCADSALPLLLEQAKIDMLPALAAPIFRKLGPTAIGPLFALAENRNVAEGVLPKLIAGVGPVAVPELQKRASGRDAECAAVAVRALRVLGPQAKDSLPTLLDLVRSSSSVSLRVEAGTAALSIEPENPEIPKAIVDGYLTAPTDRYLFADLLGRQGPRAKAALPALVKVARDPAAAISVMGAIGRIVSPEDGDLVAPLVEILVAPETKYWEGCARALTKIGAPAVPALSNLLQTNDVRTLRRATTVLVGIKPVSQETLSALMARADGEDPIASATFVEILAGAGKDAVPVLLEILKGNKPGRSTAALYALHTIAPDLQEAKRAWLPEPYVLDPYYDAGCYRLPDGSDTSPHYALFADFNNDGLEDVAISGTSFGTGGGGWSLYLKVAERKYKKIPEMEAPRGVTVFSGGQRGVGYMRIYWHMSAETGSETLFKINMDGMTGTKSVDVEWTEKDGEVPVDRAEKIPAPEGYTPKTIDAVEVDRALLASEAGKASAGGESPNHGTH